MGRIHVLDDEVINKIAAGEVVERPASVVKELVENALDAGADQITVSLELGGSRTIAVTDNGMGMGADDALAALTRHATSKIRAADDLFQISTMGFRGEALASIAAVSRFSLATCEKDAREGIKVAAAGGEAPTTWPWNGAHGTTVAVENLFYNMPVRAKFLKAPATEFSHCLELVHAFALCHPEVGFTVLHNSREHFRVAPSASSADALSGSVIGEAALRERALAVIGKDAESLLYVRSTSRYGDLEALISPPGLERPTSKQLFTFVNGRWVKDRTLRYGVLRGYHSHILKGKFPVAVVHLRMDPALVDVNVHPAKTELRFQYPSEVQNLLALAIREKLRDGSWAEGGAMLPHFSKNHIVRAGEAPLGAAPSSPSYSSFSSSPSSPSNSSLSSPSSSSPTSVFDGFADPSRVTSRSFGGASRLTVPASSSWAPRPVVDKAGLDELLKGRTHASSDESRLTPADAPPETIPWDDLGYLGSFDRCFLLFEAKGRLLVVDQHAFHERILYERFLADESLLSQSQALLVPEALELAPTDVATLLSRRAALGKRGFDFQADGETTLLVRAVPTLLARRDLVDLFSDLARDPGDDVATEPADSNAEMARLILANAACHAAVRAGEELPEGELTQLLADARKVDFFHNCPHGRRVFRWWSREQVARWFDR